MHTRNETDTQIRARIAYLINEIENMKCELNELAGDLSKDDERWAVEDYCSAVEDATSDCVPKFGYDTAIEFFDAEGEREA